MAKKRVRRRGERGSLADLMNGSAPIPSGVNVEAVMRIFDENGGPGAIDWAEMERTEAAIVAREDQRDATGVDALRDLDAPSGNSDAAMVEYLESKGALSDDHDIKRAIIIRLAKEYAKRRR
jgi:hypothetical protein